MEKIIADAVIGVFLPEALNRNKLDANIGYSVHPGVL
jgi:hypothetical protein